MGYLVAAYAAIWCIWMLYLYSLSARQRKLEKTVEALSKRLEGGGPGT